MKFIKLKKILLLFVAICLSCCSSNDDSDCTKTVRIPQIYMVDSQTFSYSYSNLEVPCDFPDSHESAEIEPPLLDGFTYEVISFDYTSDTGNDTSRLQFEIKLNNPNNFSVNGFAYFTLLSDNIQFSTNYANSLSPSCNSLDANSSCIVTLDVEENHIVGFPNSVELLDVNYYLTD